MVTDVENWERDRTLEALESYKRGLSEAPYLRKWASDLSEAEEDRNRLTFVVSTDEEDRHGDRISVQGWQFEAYMKNPVFLWAHNYTRPAIGRALDVWREQHKLLAGIEFAPTEFAQEIAALYRAGYQKGVSVGFRPLKYSIRRDTHTGDYLGIDFIEQELLEISAAPVPANQNALMKALDETPIMHAYFMNTGLPRGGAFKEILAILRSARQ